MIDTSDSTSISSWKCTAAYGNSASTIRTNPYAATFATTPLNTATAGIGIDLYASASQPWNGTSGILTANANAKQRKIQSWLKCDRRRCWRLESTNVSGVPCSEEAITPVATAAASMKNEPTSV